ncbi:FAD-dependent oxidoreductase [Candidatus Chloroploca sp. Khr17]|uniref:FAD-dependent oxidoreductase n=1 Tax=Candidatus Chloroploca sp. Khr17 TaxID=2496869 RepID=UPI00101BB010|nr:FAD-dependent oxidoreductase [Candidatus Chloroploca sp. Khr17]
MSERVIVVGGVAAGMSAASKARRMNSELELVVYERSGYVSYGACGFPYAIKGEIPQVRDVVVRTPEQFAKQGIKVHVGHEVLAVDPATKSVLVRRPDGSEFRDQWDHLVMTTGGASIRPPLPGLDLPGVFTLRTVEDALAIREWIETKKPQRGVIVGGGYIGLEMAEALAAYGIGLALIERLPQVLPNLDHEIAAHVQAELERQHVSVWLEHAVEGFAGDVNGVREVIAGGQHIPADIVILSVGIRPGVALAREAGIALGPTGAIAVDAHQRTNVPGIWAAGDVAEALHRVTGRPAWIPLGTTANKQGRVAGENVGGGNATFKGIVGTAVVKAFDYEAASSGLSEARARAEGYIVEAVSATASSRAHYMPGHQPIHVKLVYEAETRRLLGGQMVGSEGVAKRIDVIAAALHGGWTVDELGELDLSYAPPFAPVWDPVLVAANLARR